ncbi:hypothetical protein KDA11_06830, partial [Candidatus Saccharibacteria bacterium]|nr:hypothetical protein [Candidatus Saccharibacteria bacterium]
MQNPNDYGFVGNRINSIRDTFFWDTAGLENDPKRIQSVANLLRLTSPLADRVLSIDWLSEDEDELQSAIGTFEGLIATDCIKRNNLVAVPDLQIILRGFGQDNDETNYVIPADAIEYAEFPASNNPLNYDRMIFYKYLLDIVGDRQEYTDTFSSIHRFIVDK